MPSRSKVLGNGAVGRQKTLGMTRRLKPLHAILALACGAMGVLAPIIEVATLAMLDSGQDLALRRAVAFELIGDDDPWHVLEPFEQFAKELLGRLLIPPALDQDVEHVIVLIDGAPEIMALTIDGQEDFIQMPFVPWLGASTLQLIRIVLPKLATPLADGLMSHVDPAFQEQLLHVAVAQGEAVIEPDARADDLAGKAVVLIAFVLSGWRHVGCLSSGRLSPPGGMVVGIMSWAGEDGQQLDNTA